MKFKLQDVWDILAEQKIQVDASSLSANCVLVHTHTHTISVLSLPTDHLPCHMRVFSPFSILSPLSASQPFSDKLTDTSLEGIFSPTQKLFLE